MANLRVQRRRGTRGDDGASLVEFALLSPVLVLLLLGMITGGVAIAQKNSMENATREAVRYGAVYPVIAGSETDFLEDVLDVAVEAATGELKSTAPGRYVCASYVNDDGDIFRVSVSSGAPSADTGTLCFTDGRSEERVQVLARRHGEIELLVRTLRPTLETQAVTRYER